MNARVADSALASLTALHDRPNGTWWTVGAPTTVDAARGAYAFAAPLAGVPVKVYELPENARGQYVQVGIKHAASAADYAYTLCVIETDDLPTAGFTLAAYVNVATLPLAMPVTTIARDTTLMTTSPQVFRTKRRYLVFAVITTATAPASAVTFSVLSWSEDDDIPRAAV